MEFRRPCHDLIGRLQGSFPILGGDHLDHRLADQLLGRVAENALARRTDKYKMPLSIDNADGVEQEVYEICPLGKGARKGAFFHMESILPKADARSYRNSIRSKI